MNASLGRSSLKSWTRCVFRVVATIVLLIASATELSAATVTAMWDRNTETNISGYVLSYGTQSGVYTTSLDVGNVISWQLNLGAGQRYYFTAQAYNTAGQMSPRSAEIFYDIVGPAAPVITTLSPASGSPGISVTITGSSFGTTQGTSTVRFNGTTATPTSWSAGSIVTSVPSGATTGPVVVTVGGVASNGVTFTVPSAGPSITSLSPTSGAIGSSVTIAGANFGTTQGTSTVRFNGTTTTPTTWSAGSIVAPVPSGATTGPVVVTVNGTASNGVSFTVNAPSGLPAPWTTQDVGSPALAGQATHASGTFSVVGAGSDIWLASDQFRFVSQPLTGDGTIVARVGSLQNTDPWAKAAVMIRQDLTGDAPHAAALVSAGSGMALQSRATRGAGSTSSSIVAGAAPQWIRLVRAGSTFTGSYSANGTTWTQLGTVTVALPPQVYIGLAVTSHNPSATTTATFTNVTVTGSAPPPPNQAPTLTQPTNQTSSEGASVSLPLAASDPEGNPLTYSATGLPPSLSVNPTSGLISGTLTFTSAGTHTVTATASDGTLSNSKTFTWTVSDVSLGPTITSVSPTSGAIGTAVTIAGANFGTTQGTSTVRFNGTTATATSWSAGSIVTSVPSGATTGSVVVTVNGTASNGVAFTVSAPGSLPAPWTTQDVGSPAVAGQATHASGTFSVSGAGVDIWDAADQFRFVYQTLDGDGTIVARMGSLQNTHPWAKGGVMIREDLTSNAPNAFAHLTGANGMALQWRATRSGSSAALQGFSGAAPQWVRLVRSGNTLSGYYSANGTAWTLMGTRTVSMASRVYVGLAVTSHNAAVAAAATITNVTVTAGAAASPLTTLGTESSDQSSALKPTASVSAAGGLALRDYDGDGKADLAAYQPSTGEWQVLWSRSSYATGTVTQWGTSTDLPVPGDYDGDLKTDLAYYQPSSGRWVILKSNDATNLDVVLGAEGDVPVPGDYDGDGRTDIAVYSPSTGQWRILKSTTDYATEIVTLWGSATDLPVPGDYDGDGKTDPAFYRPSSGEWKILQSSTDYATNVTLALGAGNDLPVPADYDGDGATDVAVFSPDAGRWEILSSTSQFRKSVGVALGTGTDVPVPGDYDGDGKADLAVFHSGTWQVLYSSVRYASGVTVSWGRGTDVPLPRRP